MRDAIIAQINALQQMLDVACQQMLDVACQTGEISGQQYDLAFYAASAIESFINPDEWVGLDPLGDLAHAIDQLREG
jgi:hypothetical protein